MAFKCKSDEIPVIKNGNVVACGTDLKSDVRGYDLELRHDITGRRNREVVFIQTFSDESVGIFPTPVSPAFSSNEALKKWWIKHKERVIKILDSDDDNWQASLERLAHGD